MKGNAAFTTPSSVGGTHFRRTRKPIVCHPCNTSLSVAAKVQHCHTSDFQVFATAYDSSVALGPVLEGDLLAYRNRASSRWNLGAVIEMPTAEQYHIRPLCSRSVAEGGSLECFIDWEANTLEATIGSDTHEITIIEADYEERVVQDRLENPHGEVSEDCWRISTQLLDSLGVFIPRT